jgi:hypothetical protein
MSAFGHNQKIDARKTMFAHVFKAEIQFGRVLSIIPYSACCNAMK